MAATAPVSATWIPEDDLLLKNAVEAGASLEALAKGAVKFSRRFTFQELRDRWHSLLYDPDIASQASVHMFELELSGFNPSSKSYRSEQSKGNKEVPEKRKIGSIRKEYYSMRKKFRSEFFNPTDTSLLDDPDLHHCGGNGADFQAFNGEPQNRNCMLGNWIQDDYQLQEADIAILRSAFSETRDIPVTSAAVSAHNSYLTGCSNTVEDKHPNGILRNDGFVGDLSSSLRPNRTTSFEPTTKPAAISTSIKGISVNFDDHSGVQESALQQVPSDRQLLESLKMQQLSIFDSRKDNSQIAFQGLRQGEQLSSPNGNSSFHTMGFPSPQPNLPLWEPGEDFSATPLPDSLKQGNTSHDADKIIPNDGDSGRNESLVYTVVHSGALLGVGHNGSGLSNSSVVTEGEDISDSLLNLSNEDDILFIDVDGKDTSDKSCCDNLNSLLLSSPNDFPEYGASKLEPKILVVSETGHLEGNCANVESSEATTTSVDGDNQNDHHLEVKVLSTSVLNPDSNAPNDGNLICKLNTEDPEIPCNDDIFLLIHPSTSFVSSATQPITRDSMDLSSAADHKQTGQGLNLMVKGKDLARSSIWPQKIGVNILPEAHAVHSRVGFGVKSELPDTNSLASLPTDANKALTDPSQSRSLLANSSITAGRVLEEDVVRVDLKAGENPAAISERRNIEADSLKIGFPQSVANPTTSEQEESLSDDDVPYFSDIEAMILEMDLDPHDQDSHSTKQVSRYQYEDSKRAIIRLEQCAQSCLERVMTSQGALAIFYGRRLRHYIRKTEVTLGRSTDDVDVDIDLRKEGRANKISRRQAIIKMEGDGSFYLKSLGKSLISVNGKSVITGQLLSLSSSCLIEIGGMSFVFEINKKCVRRYASSISLKSKGKHGKFDWSSEQDM